MSRTVRTLLANLVKAALMSEDRASALWREEAAQALASVRACPHAVEGLKIDGLWSLAVREAEAPDLRAEEGQVSFTLPVDCPFALGEFVAPAGFDITFQSVRLTKTRLFVHVINAQASKTDSTLVGGFSIEIATPLCLFATRSLLFLL